MEAKNHSLTHLFGSPPSSGALASMFPPSSALEGRVEPCHLSSSLYYGGQDIYFHSQTHSSYPMFKKDAGQDKDSNSQSASRGNWWQGSLYY